MAQNKSNVEVTIVAGGGTYNIELADITDLHIFRGSATMVGNYSVTASGAGLGNRRFVKIRYLASLVLGGNTLTILGQAITAKQALQNLDIEAHYSGAVWEVIVTVSKHQTGNVVKADLNSDVFASNADVITGTSVDEAVQPASLKNWWTDVKTKVQTWADVITFSVAPIFSSLTASKIMASDASKKPVSVELIELITKEVSFDTGGICDNPIAIPFKGDIVNIRAYVTKLIEVTDDATITADIAGTPITTGVITLTGGSALDTAFAVTPTANYSVTAGQVVHLVAAKTTAGGRALVTMEIKRTF